MTDDRLDRRRGSPRPPGRAAADALRLCQPRPGAGARRIRAIRAAASTAPPTSPRWPQRKARSRKVSDVAAGAIAWGEPVLASAITTVAGGRLFYRGRDAVRLAETETLESVARLLRGGHGAALKRTDRPAPPRASATCAPAPIWRWPPAPAPIRRPAAAMPLALAVEAATLLDVLTDAVAGEAWRRGDPQPPGAGLGPGARRAGRGPDPPHPGAGRRPRAERLGLRRPGGRLHRRLAGGLGAGGPGDPLRPAARRRDGGGAHLRRRGRPARARARRSPTGWSRTASCRASATRSIRTATRAPRPCWSASPRRRTCRPCATAVQAVTGLAPNVDFALVAGCEALQPAARRALRPLLRGPLRRLDRPRHRAGPGRHPDPPAGAVCGRRSRSSG